MRQPQASNCSAPSSERQPRITSSERNKPERRRGLDPARVEAALARRRVLGDVGRRAAVLAAERQALQQPQRDRG